MKKEERQTFSSEWTDISIYWMIIQNLQHRLDIHNRNVFNHK
jgi:hypothetical protein